MIAIVHPQLRAIVEEMDAVSVRLRRLREHAGSERLSLRPQPQGWSAVECVVHLNVTSEAFLKVFDRALETAPAGENRRHFRRDLIGWLLCKVVEPPARLKVKTGRAFEPVSTPQADEVIGKFLQLQSELSERIVKAQGYDLQRIRIVSPFDARVKYNMYSALCLITAHQRRHLWQAERAVGEAGKSGG